MYQVPADGRRINIQSNASSVIDNGTVTLQQGSGITLSQASSTITVGQTSVDYLQAYLALNQSTNIAAADHVKFDTVINSSGSSISLDTSSTYSKTIGTASIGRFTLAANKTYFLYGSLLATTFSASGANVWLTWYNVNGVANIGETGYNTPNGRNTTQNISQGPATGIYTPSGGNALVELRFASATNLTQIGDTTNGIVYGAHAIITCVSP